MQTSIDSALQSLLFLRRAAGAGLPLALALGAAAFTASPVRAQCAGTPVQQLTPAVPVSNGQFGSGIGVDGDTIAVGRPVGPEAGLVSFYRLVAGQWTFEADVTPGFISGNAFGTSVDLSGDAAVIGTSVAQRRAYVYRRNGSNWSLEATLVPSNVSQAAQFGRDVAIEGEWIAIGASAALTPPDNNTGAVYVYRNVGGTWVEHSILYAADGMAGDEFGWDLELRGGVLVIGSMRHSAAQPGRSAAFVYRFAGTAWVQEALLQPTSAGVGAYYGRAVATDGQVVAVSDIGDTLQAGNTGVVYVYRHNGTSWVEEQQVRAGTPSAHGNYGEHVAIQADNLVTTGETTLGRTWHFRRVQGAWIELAELQGSGMFNNSGSDVALSGQDLVIGVESVNSGVSSSGIVQIYSTGGGAAACTYCTGKLNSEGCVPAIGFFGTPSFSQPSGFQITASGVIAGAAGGFAYGLTPPASIPMNGGTLCMEPPLFRSWVQISTGSGSCGGLFNLDFNAWIAGGLDPALAVGSVVRGQFWSRDQGFAVPQNVSFTDALAFVIQP